VQHSSFSGTPHPAPATGMARFFKRKGLLDVLKNISWVSLERLIRLGGALLVGTAVARYLGPASFGVFSYAYAIYALFNIVSGLGLDLLVVKEVTLRPDMEEEILGTSFLLKVAASCVTSVLAIAAAAILRPNDRLVLEVTALLSIASIFQGFEVASFFFQATLKSRLTIFPTLAVFVAACIARVFAVLSHSTLLTFAWIAAAEIAVTQLSVGICYMFHRSSFPKWHFNRVEATKLLEQSWPLMASSFLIIVYVRCDQVILGIFCSSTVVGDYSAAVKIAELWYALPLIICGSVMPQLLRIKQLDETSYLAKLQRLYDLLALSSFIVAVITMIVGKTIVALMFGPQYSGVYPILALYVWTGVFVFVGILGGQQMTYDGLVKLQLQRSLFGAVANIVLNLLLVPSFGAMGSAISTLVVQAVVSYGLDLASQKTRNMFFLKTRAYLFFWLMDRSLWKRVSLSQFFPRLMRQGVVPPFSE
jgi:PST family polysaccharide transporter